MVVVMEIDLYEFFWSCGIFVDCLCVGYLCWVLWVCGEIVGYGILLIVVGEVYIFNICIG